MTVAVAMRWSCCYLGEEEAVMAPRQRECQRREGGNRRYLIVATTMLVLRIDPDVRGE